MAYRIYVTDTLRNTALGQAPSKRWIDVIRNEPVEKVDGDEIALEIIGKLGLEVA